jgi:hypothetical protein
MLMLQFVVAGFGLSRLKYLGIEERRYQRIPDQFATQSVSSRNKMTQVNI